MVYLEWAEIEAFDGEAKPPLRSEDLRDADAANLQLAIQPYVQLLDLHYPVDDLLLDVKHGDDIPDRASNAVQERRKHSRVRAVAKLEPAQIFLAVHRLDYSAIFGASNRKSLRSSMRCRAGKRSSAPSSWLSERVPSLRRIERLLFNIRSDLGDPRLVLPARSKRARQEVLEERE